jgi:hypothetical protein
LLGFIMALVRPVKRKSQAVEEVGAKRYDLTLKGMAFIVVYFMLFHAIFYVDLPRFRLPVMPFLCIFAVYALAEMMAHLRATPKMLPAVLR